MNDTNAFIGICASMEPTHVCSGNVRRRPLRYRLHHGRPEIYLRRYGVVAAVEASFDFVIVDDNSGDRSVPKLSVVEGAVVVTEVVAFDPPRLSARGHR